MVPARGPVLVVGQNRVLDSEFDLLIPSSASGDPREKSIHLRPNRDIIPSHVVQGSRFEPRSVLQRSSKRSTPSLDSQRDWVGSTRALDLYLRIRATTTRGVALETIRPQNGGSIIVPARDPVLVVEQNRVLDSKFSLLVPSSVSGDSRRKSIYLELNRNIKDL